MPPNAWAAIQMSDLIPISASKSRFFACKRYHCVQKHPNFKVDGQQASHWAAPVPEFHKPTYLCVVQASGTHCDRPLTFLATALSDITHCKCQGGHSQTSRYHRVS